MASVGFPSNMPGATPRSTPSSAPVPLHLRSRVQSAFGERPSATIRRRPTFEQGRALEVLSRAIEYLVDSSMLEGAQPETQLTGSKLDAIRILMLLNREVFSECEAIVPLGRRLRQWAIGRRAVA